MAKKKEEIKDTKTTSIFNDLDALINSQFKDVIDLSKVDGKVKTWYDSGIYSLNYAMSRNLRKGYPAGRVSSLSGLKGTGKSLLAAVAMRDPQLDMIIILETEGGGNAKELIEFAGVDVKKVRILKAHTFGNYKVTKKNNKVEDVADNKFPVKTETPETLHVEGATRLMKKMVNALQFNKKFKEAKVLILLDSLGNLQTVREYGGTPDMGMKGQKVGQFFRTFDNAFEKSNIAF